MTAPRLASTLGHYRIVEKIGEGGMGEVYLARDEHLDREVAIKVLPAGILDESARKRFRQEALALSKLNHPNIETVHDFDSDNGIDFLALEYVPGVSLDQKLASGPLPETEIARLGVQLAEGLAAAHAEGIIHCDLKPANLRLRPDGRLKILDFGLAKLLQAPGPAAVTESVTGRFSGTMPYMAPEQLREEKLDARTDIWAAGAVLYEMATGRRPFPGSGARLIDDILHAMPVAPRALASGISPALEGIILKCLDKDRGNRYQSAQELAVDLRRLFSSGATVLSSPAMSAPLHRQRWRLPAALASLVLLVVVAGIVFLTRGQLKTPSAQPEIRSLAVLPLVNLSGDPAQDYFADGMTETLIAELSRIGALKVISRTSVMRYRKTTKSLPEIAGELKVEGVVEGSVLRAGDRVRVTAQLIHAASDRHLWAETYDRDLRDVLALHSELARAIAAQIKIKLTPQEQTDLSRAPVVNPQAHEAYLKGRYYMVKFSPEPLNKAREYFQQAISLDPSYAPAYAGLAHAYFKLAWFGELPSREAVRSAFAESKAMSEKGLAIDERLAGAHGPLCAVLLAYDWDFTNAERECRRSLELDPGSAEAHRDYAMLLSAAGRHQEAIEQSDRARQLDPLNTEVGTAVGMVFFWARDYDRALDQARRVIEIEPDLPRARSLLANVYDAKHMYNTALPEYVRWATLRGATPLEVAELEKVYRAEGRKGLYRWRLKQLEQEATRKYTPPSQFAIAYAAMGDEHQTFTWLERAYRDRDGNLLWFRTDPNFDFLRTDPRFQDLMRRIGSPR